MHSRAYATMSVSVCLSVTEVHWRIIANLGFNSDPNLPRIWANDVGTSTELFIVQWERGKGSLEGREGAREKIIMLLPAFFMPIINDY